MAASRLPKFQENFRALRGEMTQAQFSDKLGISRPTVGLYESGARIPDAEILCIISQKCGVSVDYLLGLSEHPTISEDMKTALKITGLSQGAIVKISRFMLKDVLSAFLEEDTLYDLIQDISLYRDELKAVKDVVESLKSNWDFRNMINFGMWFNDARIKRQGFRDAITLLIERIVPSKDVLSEAEDLYNSKVIYRPATMRREDHG